MIHQLFTWLLFWLQKFLGLSHGPEVQLRGPSGLTFLEIKSMSANVRLDWVLPVPSADQLPLSHVAIDARVLPDGTWSRVNEVAAPGTMLRMQDVASGKWEFRASVVDISGAHSGSLDVSITVPFAAPSGLEDLTVSLE